MKTLTTKAAQLELRARRERAGLTIDELGRRCRVERSRLSRAERGYLVLDDKEIERLQRELDEVES